MKTISTSSSGPKSPITAPLMYKSFTLRTTNLRATQQLPHRRRLPETAAVEVNLLYFDWSSLPVAGWSNESTPPIAQCGPAGRGMSARADVVTYRFLSMGICGTNRDRGALRGSDRQAGADRTRGTRPLPPQRCEIDYIKL